MSHNSARDSQEESQTTDEERIEIRSPYRPFPLSAKKELREADSSVEFPDDDSRAALVTEIPPDDVLEAYELTITRTDSPEEVWEDRTGTIIEIFSDRVERNGVEMNIDPDEASEKAAEQDAFTRCQQEEEST